MEGCLDKTKTSAPRLNTLVATYLFAPLIKLTTAITEATPMTTPMSVSTLRSLCAHKLLVAMTTDSEKFIGGQRFSMIPAVLLVYTPGGPRKLRSSRCSYGRGTPQDGNLI